MPPKTKAPVVIDVQNDQVDLEEAIAASAQQMAEHTTTIMNTFGDGLVYERSRIVTEARFFMSQSAEAMLEAGKRLIVLKENEPHGEFMNIVEDQLGLSYRTAHQMAQAALKYTSPKLNSKLQALAVLGKTKLFELMAEDDDQLAELADGGTVAGLTLDKIDTMTSRELKKALREAREDISAKDQVITDKTRKLNEASVALKKIKKDTPNDDAIKYRKEVAGIESDIEERIRTELRPALMQISEHADETGIDHSAFIAAQLDLLDRAILQMRAELGVERTANLGAEWEENKDAA